MNKIFQEFDLTPAKIPLTDLNSRNLDISRILARMLTSITCKAQTLKKNCYIYQENKQKNKVTYKNCFKKFHKQIGSSMKCIRRYFSEADV